MSPMPDQAEVYAVATVASVLVRSVRMAAPSTHPQATDG